MRLDGEGRPARDPDRRAEQDVVDEKRVRRKLLADGGRVRLDEALELDARQILEAPRLEALVAVEDEHGQQPAGQLRADDPGAAEVEQLGMAFLADDHDVMARTAPFACERARVDVRARPAEQVAVPDDDPHRATLVIKSPFPVAPVRGR